MEMIRLPLQNMVPISVFYQLPLFLGDPILLGEINMSGGFLDLVGLGAIFIGHDADGDFVLDEIHEY